MDGKSGGSGQGLGGGMGWMVRVGVLGKGGQTGGGVPGQEARNIYIYTYLFIYSLIYSAIPYDPPPISLFHAGFVGAHRTYDFSVTGPSAEGSGVRSTKNFLDAIVALPGAQKYVE